MNLVSRQSKILFDYGGCVRRRSVGFSLNFNLDSNIDMTTVSSSHRDSFIFDIPVLHYHINGHEDAV